MMQKKRIPLVGACNVRDLGGIPVKGNGIVKWNCLYRADGLNRLTKEDWNQLYEAGVRTIIDLRSSSEMRAMPDQVPAGMKYEHCPLMAENEGEQEDLEIQMAHAFSKSLKESYIQMVKEGGSYLVKALREVIKGFDDGAVLFHCTAGKDRTGVLAATLLTLLGAEEEDIIADYQVSFTYNKKGINTFFGNAPELEFYLPLLTSDPGNMGELLSYLHTVGVSSYLGNLGLTAEEQQKLKNSAIDWGRD